MAHVLDAQDGRGRTALHRAVIDKNPEAVKQLLQAGASPAVRDTQGRKGFTPMWYACCQTRDPMSVSFLKTAGAPVEQQMLDEVKRQSAAEPFNKDIKAIKQTLGM